jgi:benzoyl-CoA reductase/2-hydroxyglutaryl-CoA dehydratase subunit BcrC/BadD/HgdB
MSRADAKKLEEHWSERKERMMLANTKGTWFDDASSASLIAEQAQRLDSFIEAIADGKVTDDELRRKRNAS